MRAFVLILTLVLGFGLAVASLQTPPPRPIETAPTMFAADRAMVDIREIAASPHPVSSADHVRVRGLLIERLDELGLSPTLQTAPLGDMAAARLERWGGPPATAPTRVHNILGRLAGRDQTAPAVLLMAHYDTTWDSPGAADNTTGVAAILEIVRAIQARGPTERDILILFSDAEELGLDGARAFFTAHSWRDRIGFVINLEARGGGGRAMMFETGRDNAGTIDLVASRADRFDGGVTTNSLAGFVYALMPNGTDFTIARDRGLAGVNFAFQGRPHHYHTPLSTPDRLDVGAVQHIGSQALEIADHAARARRLPAAGPDPVHADLFGLIVVRHPPAWGWGLIGVAGLALLVAGIRFSRVGVTTVRGVLCGVLSGMWLMVAGVVVIQCVRVLAGPVTGRIESPQDYYTLLARLPWMEAASVLAILGLVALTMARPGGRLRWTMAAALVLAVALVQVMSGFDVVLTVMAVPAIALTLWSAAWPVGRIDRWLGAITLGLLIAVAGQVFAPLAAYPFVWIALAGALLAAGLSLMPTGLDGPVSRLSLIVAGILVVGWITGLGHAAFLGVGIDLPGLLAPLALLALAVVAPLSVRPGRFVTICAFGLITLACAVSLGARIAEPTPTGDVATST